MAKTNWRQQRERQQREALRTQREYERLVAQQQREAERAAAQADRERKAQYAAEREAEAEERTAAVERRAEELTTLLLTGIKRRKVLDLVALKKPYLASQFNPGHLGTPEPEPSWERFAPPEPGFLTRMFGGESRRMRAVDQARIRFEQELLTHREREQHRRAELDKAQRDHQRSEAEGKRQADERNAEIDALERSFRAGEPAAVERCVRMAVETAQLPEGLRPK